MSNATMYLNAGMAGPLELQHENGGESGGATKGVVSSASDERFQLLQE
jgi:hypothetical protein